MTNNSCEPDNARGMVDDQGSSLGYLVGRRIVAVTEVVVSGGTDPGVLLELRRALLGLRVSDELKEIVAEILRRHSRNLAECEILIITEGETLETGVTAVGNSVDTMPLSAVDRVLRGFFRTTQYELYFEGFVADAQRSIWQAKIRGDAAVEVREYVWFFINLIRMVPAWVWAIALKAVAGIMSRP